MNPTKFIENIQVEFLRDKSSEERKILGQYLTGSIIADYMSSQIHVQKDIFGNKAFRIIDAGAGAGILSAAAAVRCLAIGIKNVHVVCFELDKKAVSFLEKTMALVADYFTKKKSKFSYEIICDDFVLSRPDKDFAQKFDLSVINPPYFKYNVSDSPYSQATKDLFKGNPNIYASFMAIVLACLRPNGQMIAIVPRSFTNGLYFHGFRDYLLGNSNLNFIHVFKKRNEVFKNVDVLQENIICSFIKEAQSKYISISSSESSNDLENRKTSKYRASLIIDRSNHHNIIRIPETEEEFEIMKIAELLPSNFADAGYFISTGPVVEHRTHQYLSDKPSKGKTVPLIRAHNFNGMSVHWTGENQKDLSFNLNQGFEKHLLSNKIYVVLKRITSKDEHKRLVANVYQPDKKNEFIGFTNKINYLGVIGENLTLEEAYGLTAFLNSTFMDKYFRCISGNTQVNATEVRLFKFPNRNTITKLGTRILKLNALKQEQIDVIVNAIINKLKPSYEGKSR